MADRPGGDPTEEPTPSKLRKARLEGQVARSGDLTSAAAMAAGLGVVVVGGGVIAGQAATMMAAHLGAAGRGDGGSVGVALELGLGQILALSLPVAGAAMIAAVLVGAVQTGGLFTMQTLAPKAERVDPMAGLKRVFSMRSVGELIKGLVKLVVVGWVAWATLEPVVGDALLLAGRPVGQVATFIARVAGLLAVRVAVVYLGVGFLDYLWQRHRLHKELMMTRDEVKREHKESEGDPQHKAQRQRAHRDILMHGMVADVARATCVIVNPDHIAVALRWDGEEGEAGAPTIVAKGERIVAQEIKEVARRHGVPVYRDVRLARALNEMEIGDEIPEELYDAVAEVLRFLSEG